MKLLLDMNLSLDWLPLLRENGFEAIHWSEVGDGRAPDSIIMQWARDRGYIVFTHDLDFGILLAHTKNCGPSVIQVRAQDIRPGHLGTLILGALRVHEQSLKEGALVTVSEAWLRVRVLPI